MKNTYPEIIVEYDYIQLNVNNISKKLNYRIREYMLVPIDKEESYKKIHKCIKKTFKVKGELVERLYREYSIKLITLDKRKIMLDKILDKVYNDNMTLRDEINIRWEKDCIKSKSSMINTKDTNLLENMSNYILGGLEGDNILTMDLSRVIKQKKISLMVQTYGI